MAIHVLKDCALYVDGLNLTGVTNDVALKISSEALDVTTFGSSTRARISGLRDSMLSASGFLDLTSTTPTYDATANAFVATDALAAVMPLGATAGEVGYFGTQLTGTYDRFGAVGEANPYALELEGNGVMARGTIMAASAGTTTLTTGTGSIVQLGATTSTQSIYCQLHVVSVGGTSTPTITVTVKSAALVGFGSPTTRASFTARTAVGAQRIVVAGPVTDQFWRVDYTVSGTSPTFGFVTLVGIQ